MTLYVTLDLLYEVAFWLCAYEFVNHLAVLNEENGGNGSDAVVHAHLWVLVHVELANIHLTIVFLREFLDHRADSAARTTPLRPKVYDR